MEDVIQADIFFFVTTVMVVLVGITMVVALIYLIKFIRDLRELAATVSEEAEELIYELEEFKESLKDKAETYGKFLGVFTTTKFLKAIFSTKKRRKK